MEAARHTRVLTTPLVVRTSFTTAQTTTPLGKVAVDEGVKKVITIVSDYGPGVDAENAFKKAFEAAGGKVVEAIRMPMNTTDFSPIMQRVRDSGAEGLFAFLPSGPPTLGFAKAYSETGLKKAGIKFYAPGDLTQESDLPADERDEQRGRLGRLFGQRRDVAGERCGLHAGRVEDPAVQQRCGQRCQHAAGEAGGQRGLRHELEAVEDDEQEQEGDDRQKRDGSREHEGLSAGCAATPWLRGPQAVPARSRCPRRRPCRG